MPNIKNKNNNKCKIRDKRHVSGQTLLLFFLKTNLRAEKLYSVVGLTYSFNEIGWVWCVMVLNATFNKISVISWWSVLLVEETEIPGENCRKSLTNFITQYCNEYTSPWAGFELTTLVVIGTDCTGSCKSNYHTITTWRNWRYTCISINGLVHVI